MENPNEITVAGGVYHEYCLRPHWNEIFGSGGRAACALSALGASVTLHSYFDSSSQSVFEAKSTLENITLRINESAASPRFRYTHGLSSPSIVVPTTNNPFEVDAVNLLRFGMLDGDAVCHAERAVYDPQSPTKPEHFSSNGSTAEHLTVVSNLTEARLLSNLPDGSAKEIAEKLFETAGVGAVVIKQGALGAYVSDGSLEGQVAAYESSNVWKIGSGDNFAAHFAYRYLICGDGIMESANCASKATSYYCNSKGFCTLEQLEDYQPIQLELAKPIEQITVYLAAPFFSLAQLWLVDEVRTELRRLGLNVFSPYHDVGLGKASDVVHKDLEALRSADIVFAIADGLDPGTIFEVGYARSRDTPVIIYAENLSDEQQKMMVGSQCEIHSDFVSAIYHTIWHATAA